MNNKKGKAKKYLFILLSTLVMSCHSDAIEETPDVVAVVDAEYDLGWLINHYMIYPKSETTVNRAGIVTLSWIVTKEGMVKDVEASKGVIDQPVEFAIARRRLENEEVLEINQAILNNLIYSVGLLKFTPALKNGKQVNSKMTTTIEFVLI